MKKLVFYTEQEVKELKEAVESGVKISVYAKENAERFGRSEQSLISKLVLLKKGVKSYNSGTFTHDQETILRHSLMRGDNPTEASARYSKQWNIPRKAISMKLRWLKGDIDKMFTPIVEEGIQLPDGFVFEGVPTKVALYKDHFRVYFK